METTSWLEQNDRFQSDRSIKGPDDNGGPWIGIVGEGRGRPMGGLASLDRSVFPAHVQWQE